MIETLNSLLNRQKSMSLGWKERLQAKLLLDVLIPEECSYPRCSAPVKHIIEEHLSYCFFYWFFFGFSLERTLYVIVVFSVTKATCSSLCKPFKQTSIHKHSVEFDLAHKPGTGSWSPARTPCPGSSSRPAHSALLSL